MCKSNNFVYISEILTYPSTEQLSEAYLFSRWLCFKKAQNLKIIVKSKIYKCFYQFFIDFHQFSSKVH